MSSYEAVLDLVDRIYAAAEDPAAWPAALEPIADATGSAVSIIYRNMEAREGGVDAAARVTPDAAAAYHNYYHRLDPWGNSARAATLVRTGAVIDGDELIERSDLYATEYYNDFAKPNRLTRVLAGTIARHGPFASVISLIRDDANEPHGTAERKLLTALMPHLARAMEIHRRLLPISVRDAAAVDTLDSLSSAVILLDEQGRTIFVNRAAECLLARHDGLFVEQGCLAAAAPIERDALRVLILRAAGRRGGDLLHAGGALSISRVSMRRPYSVLVAPLGSRYRSSHAPEAAVAVFVADPDDRTQGDVGTLTRLFRLTPAEGRLAAGLATGAPMADVAGALGIARETARSHLRSIFAKTGTTRQAELVRILARACPILPRT